MSKFQVLRPRMLQRFNRRDFLRLGTLSAALPIFDVKLPPGLDFTLLNSPTPQKYLIETMPGGVALFDYNNDGLLDIFLVNGGRVTNQAHRPRILTAAILAIGTASIARIKMVASPMSLKRPDFPRQGPEIMAWAWQSATMTTMAMPTYSYSYGKNILYHNNGDWTFTDVTAKAGVAGGGWSVSAGFFDFDNDGHLDLFVTRYMEWDTRHSKMCGGAWQTYCPPA